MSKIIRTSKHTLKFTNKGKRETLSTFVDLFKEAVEFYIDQLWNNTYTLTKEGKEDRVLDVATGQYNCPSYFPSNETPPDTKLTSRALKCAKTQACSIVSSVLNKRKKDEELLEWKVSKKIKDEKLIKRLSKPPTKPILKDFSCELNSLNLSLKGSDNSFDSWLDFYSLFKEPRGFKFTVPLKNHSQAITWQSQGKFLNGISISKNHVTLRYEVDAPELKTKGETVAIDQGLKSMLTTSRGDEFPRDCHNHTLETIIIKLSKCRLGSKAFAKASAHRKNYVNWLVKQLDLTLVKEIKLEKIENIKFGVNVQRMMKHWSNPLIRDAIVKLGEERGVLVTFVDNEYNSQRCNKCGWVQKANRVGKMFACKHCLHEDDADANASKNIECRYTLKELPFGFRKLKLNIKGFFWTPEGIFLASGEEPTVPQTIKA